MKHETVFGIALTLGSLALASAGWAAVPLQSERGDMPVAEEFEQAPQLHQYQKDGLPIERNYLLQPPLIPHQIEGYTITPKFNKCMSCHSWSKYKEANATKISQTHFESRDGIVLANISPRRYFCVQCHVPQTNARPLVENTFQPVEALRAR
jgi:nitrate reductase (cytochrome), electron transfer subunit